MKSFFKTTNKQYTMTTQPKNVIIFIDGSYFCFHRYYSLVRWWKSAYPENQDVLLNPFENEIFRSKFTKTVVQTVKDIPKKLGLKGESIKMIVGKDCKREDIWRNEFCDNYKGNRKNDGVMVGPFFKSVYDDKLFLEAGVQSVLQCDKLEADDCIALAAKHLTNNPEIDKIYIITSDMDYLQLHSDKIKIFDLSFNNIAEKKSSFGDAATNLFCKIVMGDTSDNISSIFKKCGPKTAIKCWQDPKYFEERLKKEDSQKKFEKNQLIIDFNYIPVVYINAFYTKYSEMLNAL